MAQTFDEICEEAGILKRNPQLAEAWREEVRIFNLKTGQETTTVAMVSEWHRIRELGLAYHEAQKSHGWYYKRENAPPVTADHETKFRFALAKDAACNAVVDAERAYRRACDLYFLGDAK